MEREWCRRIAMTLPVTRRAARPSHVARGLFGKVESEEGILGRRSKANGGTGGGCQRARSNGEQYDKASKTSTQVDCDGRNGNKPHVATLIRT